jgi:hypothetical protein
MSNYKYFIDPNPSKLSSREISEQIIAYRELHKHPEYCGGGLTRQSHDKMIKNCKACQKLGRKPTDWVEPVKKSKYRKKK